MTDDHPDDTAHSTVDAPTGARARARTELTAEIVETARRQLAEVGAASLSLRAVARELGMVSSAVYRYVASRDDLLTRLIIEAYDSLGDVAETASAEHADQPAGQRWVAVAEAVRGWAVERPHEWALLYGSPVPGYAAPEDTVGPGTRVSLALVAIVREAADAGLVAPRPARTTVPDLGSFAAVVDLDVDDDIAVRLVAAWTQLFGLISFELFGQTKGLVTDHRTTFRAASESMADWLGLPF